MASSSLITSRLLALKSLVYILVMFVVKSSVQAEKCFPYVGKTKHWTPVGGRFEVNCTLTDCDNRFETQIWERDGKRVRNHRAHDIYFHESKRVILQIDPVLEEDKGEYSCRTQISEHVQNIELIIGVEPTTTTTTTTPAPTTTTTMAPTTPTSASTTVKRTISSPTATATLKVITTPVKIISTTKMPLGIRDKTTLETTPNHSTQLLNNFSFWTSLLLVVIQIFLR